MDAKIGKPADLADNEPLKPPEVELTPEQIKEAQLRALLGDEADVFFAFQRETAVKELRQRTNKIAKDMYLETGGKYYKEYTELYKPLQVLMTKAFKVACESTGYTPEA